MVKKYAIVEVRKPDGTMDGIYLMGFRYVGSYRIHVNLTDLGMGGSVTLAPWQVWYSVRDGKVEFNYNQYSQFKVPNHVAEEVQELVNRVLQKAKAYRRHPVGEKNR